MDSFHPASEDEVLIHYRHLHKTHQSAKDAALKRRTRFLQVLLAWLVAFLLLARTYGTSAWSALPYLIWLAVFIFLITRYLRTQAAIDKQDRLLFLYQAAIARVDGTEPQSGKPGPVSLAANHLYARDLDLLGPHSLFGLLATVRTVPGEAGLARYLLNPATHEESVARQQAIRELTPHTELRERIALLGASPVQNISSSLLEEWLTTAAPAFHRFIRPALILTVALSVLLLRLGTAHTRPWTLVLPNLALVLAVQSILCFRLKDRVSPLLVTSVRLQQSVTILTESLTLLDSLRFTAPKLQALQQQARQPAAALRQLRRLQSQLAIAEQRGQPYFLLLSLFLAGGTHAAISIAQWKQEHAAQMQQWLAAWSEFEALSALANYAYEHPQHTWPTLLPASTTATYQATGLAHPLLRNAQPNDITLAPNSSAFYLISGSNMAGKSTLLRAIGVNAVLAYAGAPVAATSLALTPLTLGASLALTDSLAEGKSKFLAEVERLSAIVTASKRAPVLFLVDEIFSGTNSLDRRAAAESVLRGLLTHNAIGALSTHDLALTSLVTDTNRGLNLHMASPDPADPLAFDYKLKPGVNRSSNAMAIIRLLGLELSDPQT